MESIWVGERGQGRGALGEKLAVEKKQRKFFNHKMIERNVQHTTPRGNLAVA